MAGRARAVSNGDELTKAVVALGSALQLEAREQVRVARRIWGAERRIDVVLLPFLDVAEKLTAPNDVFSQASWRAVRAPIVARQGRVDEAIELAETAAHMLAATESLSFEADALCDLAAVLRIAGKPHQAHGALESAERLYKLKGNVVALERLVFSRLRGQTERLVDLPGRSAEKPLRSRGR